MKQQIMNLLGKLGITTNTFDIIHVAIMILQELKLWIENKQLSNTYVNIVQYSNVSEVDSKGSLFILLIPIKV